MFGRSATRCGFASSIRTSLRVDSNVCQRQLTGRFAARNQLHYTTNADAKVGDWGTAAVSPDGNNQPDSGFVISSDRPRKYRSKRLQNPTKDDQITMFCRLERALSADRTMNRRAAVVRRLMKATDSGNAEFTSFKSKGDPNLANGAKNAISDELQAMSLRDINLIASDVLDHGATLPDIVTSIGMVKAASSRSTTSLGFYLTHARSKPPSNVAEILVKIREWVEGDDFAGLHGPLDRQELLALLVGYAKKGYPDRKSQNLSPICSMLPTSDAWKEWDDLLACVFELGGAEAILHTWDTHLRRGKLIEGEGMGVAEARNFVDIVVQRLCQPPTPSPEIAWKIAAPYLDLEIGLSTNTLEQLLGFPDLIDQHGGLRPHMEAALKRRLESWAKQIEEDLGVEWDAEGGKHLPVGEESTSMLSDASRIAMENAALEGDPDYKVAIREEAERESRAQGSEWQRSQELDFLAIRRQRREQFEQQQAKRFGCSK